MNSFVTNEINSKDELDEIINNSKIVYDKVLIDKAYHFINNLFKDKLRASGNTMMPHTLTVAAYVIRLNLDTVSVVSALLHDVIEKGNINIDLIDKEFGTEVAFIVDGLTHIREFSKKASDNEKDIENFKNLIFNATEDVRIVIIRICEKLHNLLTLDSLNEEIRIKAARKALNIYAPLAEYLGLGFFQRSMEDLAFSILEPDKYHFIEEHLNKVYKESRTVIEDFEDELGALFSKYNIRIEETQSRKKGVYSAYKKMRLKYSQGGEITNESFEDIKDIIAFRIIVENIQDCYLVLGLVHSTWEYSNDDFRDYISSPKDNGYQSIHTIISFRKQSIEIQIRTKQMHEYNEFGPACHIAYKLQGEGKDIKDTLTWTRDLVKWQGGFGREEFKIKAFVQSVFVFTPKGLVLRLPIGSSPLDFAYRVHTRIGDHYLGAKVNGKIVNMNYKLQTGDVIEILTSKNTSANRDWLKFAKSTSTKARIKKEIRHRESETFSH